MPAIYQDIDPWFTEGLEVRCSGVHGQGLFTKKCFNLGSDILRMGGCLFHISARKSSNVMPSTTTALSEEVLLAEPPAGSKDFSDYLNHSCNPNIGFRDALSIIAIKDIIAGEELTIDYSFFECDSTWKLKNTCNCGAHCCRKVVTGEDWKTINPSDKQFKYYSPFIKRRILSLHKRG